MLRFAKIRFFLKFGGFAVFLYLCGEIVPLEYEIAMKKKLITIIGILVIFLSSCKERSNVVDVPCSDIETIISAWNESSKMKVEFTKIKDDTLYVNIPDASHMTQRMGSTGAMQILASLVYALTENHTFVYIDFEEGDHASPGKYTRENFQFVVCY